MSSKLSALSARSDGYLEIEKFLKAYTRGENIIVNNLPSYSVENAAAEIIRGHNAWSKAPGEQVLTLTYSFLNRPSDYFIRNSSELGSFSAFSAVQKAQAKLSLQSWADVSNIRFVEVSASDRSNITFGNYSKDNGAGGFALVPKPLWGTAETWYPINSRNPENATPENGNYGRQTLTHEIGHTLGLSHPGDYNAGIGQFPTYADATYAEDTRAYSVMSYWSENKTGQDFKGAYSAAPLLDDIAAIQALYGANLSTRTGDTIYGFGSNTGRDFYTATSATSKLVFAVWDAGGNDTLNFSGFSQDQKINLNERSLSDVGGLRGNVSIAVGVTVENATGGSGNDVLVGNSVSNILKGGAGNDIIYGGLGADELWGGVGADTFVYGSANDSRISAQDRILDFVSGQDKIDLSGLDAFVNGSAVLQYVNSFTGKVGQAILSYNAATNTGGLGIDFNGDAYADFAISLVGQATQADIVV